MNRTTNYYLTNIDFDIFILAYCTRNKNMLTLQVYDKFWPTLYYSFKYVAVQSWLVCPDNTIGKTYNRNNWKLIITMLGTNKEKQDKLNII